MCVHVCTCVGMRVQFVCVRFLCVHVYHLCVCAVCGGVYVSDTRTVVGGGWGAPSDLRGELRAAVGRLPVEVQERPLRPRTSHPCLCLRSQVTPAAWGWGCRPVLTSWWGQGPSFQVVTRRAGEGGAPSEVKVQEQPGSQPLAAGGQRLKVVSWALRGQRLPRSHALRPRRGMGRRPRGPVCRPVLWLG